MNGSQRNSRAVLFREMHANDSPLLILPNAWDAMSALMLQRCGFAAIGTTSAGIAASLGLPDGERIGADAMLAAVERISSAVDVPVTADLEAGYGHTPDTIGELARMAAEAGAVGMNIEDGMPRENGKPMLASAAGQADRIRAVREETVSSGMPLFINARIDTYWLQIGDSEERLEETIRRAALYREAGADGIFVPGLSEPGTIAEVSRRIGLPLNVLAVPGMPRLKTLAELGVKRVSTGSGPYRAALTMLRRVGTALLQEGSYDGLLQDMITYGELMDILAGGREEREG